MLAVIGDGLASNIERLNEKDTARFDAIYKMKINLPRAGTTKEQMAAMRLAHSDFAIRIAATKRKGDALAAVLQLQDTCKALQDKLHALDTLEYLS
jgi:nitroimidazol reductase NimA-like FMN-containing flavoprotein (pyridoxamine 5'-phosphate oxidase superfamily)